MAARASLLGHGDDPVPGARNGAADEQEVALGVDLDHGEPELGVARGPHVARHPLALDDARRVGARADRARLPVPWVAGPPPNPWRCTTPWKPRPLVVPVTLTRSPAAKMSTLTSAPGAGASP